MSYIDLANGKRNPLPWITEKIANREDFDYLLMQGCNGIWNSDGEKCYGVATNDDIVLIYLDGEWYGDLTNPWIPNTLIKRLTSPPHCINFKTFDALT